MYNYMYNYIWIYKLLCKICLFILSCLDHISCSQKTNSFHMIQPLLRIIWSFNGQLRSRSSRILTSRSAARRCQLWAMTQ